MLRLAVLLGAWVLALGAAAAEPKIGVVVMHGKGSGPAQFVSELAAGLEERGFLVANLEMPWSARRNYDADVAAGEKQVDDALQALRAKGAAKVFVAGHSQGGLFALHLGRRLRMDGVVAIAPGGNVGAALYQQKIGASLAEAKKYVAEGKGAEPQRLLDFEGSRGVYPVGAVPSAYVTWFDPDGAMNEFRALEALPPTLPVLLVAPKRDYPGLRALKDRVFQGLPRTPYTRLYEPDADHLHSPAASVDEIARWAAQVANAGK